MRLLLLISCISAVLFKECWASDDQLLVSVEQGQLRGSYMKAQNGRQIAAFRGIPYAEPPVDQLRFQVTSIHHLVPFLMKIATMIRRKFLATHPNDIVRY